MNGWIDENGVLCLEPDDDMEADEIHQWHAAGLDAGFWEVKIVPDDPPKVH